MENSIWTVLAVGALAFIAIKKWPKKQHTCAACGFVGFPKKIIKGNLLLEIILWVFFLIPGVLYTIWRFTTKSFVCPKCGKKLCISRFALQY